jgi:hypothetical protein
MAIMFFVSIAKQAEINLNDIKRFAHEKRDAINSCEGGNVTLSVYAIKAYPERRRSSTFS